MSKKSEQNYEAFLEAISDVGLPGAIDFSRWLKVSCQNQIAGQTDGIVKFFELSMEEGTILSFLFGENDRKLREKQNMGLGQK